MPCDFISCESERPPSPRLIERLFASCVSMRERKKKARISAGSFADLTGFVELVFSNGSTVVDRPDSVALASLDNVSVCVDIKERCHHRHLFARAEHNAKRTVGKLGEQE